MAKRGKKLWLMKSEPDAYSIDDLERDGREPWDGIRNYQARNMMRDEMKIGDEVFFYHSNCKEPGIVGIMKVASEPYPDPTQFDKKSKYCDPKSKKDDPRWSMVDVEFVEKFDDEVSLQTLKDEPALQDMRVTQKGSRLSVQPVDKRHFTKVLKMARAKTKV